MTNQTFEHVFGVVIFLRFFSNVQRDIMADKIFIYWSVRDSHPLWGELEMFLARASEVVNQVSLNYTMSMTMGGIYTVY